MVRNGRIHHLLKCSPSVRGRKCSRTLRYQFLKRISRHVLSWCPAPICTATSQPTLPEGS
uniref:Uncharacterized protein n=1 Tax=Arundo donax TaxID=35708 RepID=A0A0A9BDB5_ARUDO